MSILRALADIFTSVPEPSAPERILQVAEPTRSVGAATLAETVSFIQRELSKLAAHGGAAIDGRLYVLDFHQLETQAEGNPNTFRRAARRAIEAAATRHLLKKDYYHLLDQLGVLIVFHDGARERSQLACATIAQDVLSRLFGDGADAASVRVHAARQDGTNGVLFDDQSLPNLLAGLLVSAEVRRYGAPDVLDQGGPAHPRAGTGFRPSPDWEADRKPPPGSGGVAIDEDALQAGIDAALSEALSEFDWLAAHLAARSEMEADEHGAVTDEAALVKAVAAAEVRQGKAPLGKLRVDFWFEPFFDFSRSIISTHGIYAGIAVPGEPEAVVYTDLPGLGEETIARFDILCLQRAIFELLSAEDLDKVNLICAKVHYSTILAAGFRRELLQLCGGLPPRLRRRLVWVVVGVPANCWSNGLLFVTACLRPFGRAILVDSDPTMSCIDNASLGKVHATGLDLRRHPIADADLLPQLQRFAARAKSRQLSIYLAGCGSISIAKAGLAAGYTYLNGPALSPRSLTSAGARTFDPRRLLGLSNGNAARTL